MPGLTKGFIEKLLPLSVLLLETLFLAYLSSSISLSSAFLALADRMTRQRQQPLRRCPAKGQIAGGRSLDQGVSPTPRRTLCPRTHTRPQYRFSSNTVANDGDAMTSSWLLAILMVEYRLSSSSLPSSMEIRSFRGFRDIVSAAPLFFFDSSTSGIQRVQILHLGQWSLSTPQMACSLPPRCPLAE